TWYGVRVDDQGWVIEINLRENNLKGTVPEALGDLPALRQLDLSFNQLSGVLVEGETLVLREGPFL
ncbi:unnamed protein product, partial [Choristocarpus tenellus]